MFESSVTIVTCIAYHVGCSMLEMDSQTMSIKEMHAEFIPQNKIIRLKDRPVILDVLYPLVKMYVFITMLIKIRLLQ